VRGFLRGDLFPLAFVVIVLVVVVVVRLFPRTESIYEQVRVQPALRQATATATTTCILAHSPRTCLLLQRREARRDTRARERAPLGKWPYKDVPRDTRTGLREQRRRECASMHMRACRAGTRIHAESGFTCTARARAREQQRVRELPAAARA